MRLSKLIKELQHVAELDPSDPVVIVMDEDGGDSNPIREVSHDADLKETFVYLSSSREEG